MQTYRPPHENTKIEVGKFKDSFVCYWRYIRIILREIGTPVSFEIDVVDANEKESVIRYTLEDNKFLVKVDDRKEICVSSKKMIQTIEQIQDQFEYEFLYAIREYDENKESLAILELAKLGDATIKYSVPAIVPIKINNEEHLLKILGREEDGKVIVFLDDEENQLAFFEAALYIASDFISFKLNKQKVYENIATGRTVYMPFGKGIGNTANNDGIFKRVDLNVSLGVQVKKEKDENFELSMLKEASGILKSSTDKKRRHRT